MWPLWCTGGADSVVLSPLCELGLSPRRQASVPGLAGEPLVHLDVPGPGGRDDLRRHLRCRRPLVPAGTDRPVADGLLVERALRAAGLPLVGRPEPRRVGR